MAKSFPLREFKTLAAQAGLDRSARCLCRFEGRQPFHKLAIGRVGGGCNRGLGNRLEEVTGDAMAVAGIP